MKRTFLFIVLSILLPAAQILTGCMPAKQNPITNQDITAEQNDADNAVAFAAAWKAFKTEAEIKIMHNESRIAHMRVNAKKAVKTLALLYEQDIAVFEQKNDELKRMIENFENSQSDLSSFKREFNIDLHGLEEKLNELAVK